MTLNDESDYIRTIDYSPVGNVIYSVSDSGIARMWDVNVGKIVAEWSSKKKEAEVSIEYKISS